MGTMHKDFKLRVGLFGAEGCTEEMRAEIERTLGHLSPRTTTA